MIPPSPSFADPEEIALDSSTRPTTPEESSSSSPILRPQDDPGHLASKSRNNSRSLASTLFDTNTRTPPVRNICCVGAGYVGEFAVVACAPAKLT